MQQHVQVRLILKSSPPLCRPSRVAKALTTSVCTGSNTGPLPAAPEVEAPRPLRTRMTWQSAGLAPPVASMARSGAQRQRVDAAVAWPGRRDPGAVLRAGAGRRRRPRGAPTAAPLPAPAGQSSSASHLCIREDRHISWQDDSGTICLRPCYGASALEGAGAMPRPA